MKIEDYLKSLPQEIISGENVELPANSLREIFRFVELSKDDIFYHLGCGTGRGLEIAMKEFNVKRVVGIDIDKEKISQARKRIDCDLFCHDIVESDISDATVILFWFTDEKIIEKMMEKFASLSNCKIITIWSPLPECLPEKIQFPYIINQYPFKKAKDLQEQLLAIFGVKCIDFVTAWEFAERYTKAISGPESENDRFLTIIQSLVIWINAKNLGVACGDEIPESIKTYIGILRNFFNIEIEHLLKK